MVGQRLLFVDLAARAKSAPAPEILREIRADIAFWREVQKSSDFLITRMISIGAIRQHFFFANLVLREIPAGQAEELIAAWSVPFSVGELSLRRTMAGELSYAEGNLRHWLDGTDTPLIASEDDPRLQWTGRIGSTLARPYFQPQDQFNHFASMYLDVATRFEVPLDQYSKVRETFLESDPPGISYQVYNLTGHILRGLGVGMTSFTSYPMRVGSIEGMRRGALVTAQLRERGVPQEQVAAELKNAELRDPFHLVPFEWNEDEKAVIYTGPESEGARYRHPYFY
jgi:hypothetical protein